MNETSEWWNNGAPQWWREHRLLAVYDREMGRAQLDELRRRAREVVAEMMQLKPHRPPPREWLEIELRAHKETDE